MNVKKKMLASSHNFGYSLRNEQCIWGTKEHSKLGFFLYVQDCPWANTKNRMYCWNLKLKSNNVKPQFFLVFLFQTKATYGNKLKLNWINELISKSLLIKYNLTVY